MQQVLNEVSRIAQQLASLIWQVLQFIWNWSFGQIVRMFQMPFNEKHSLQFRWEVFNLTNTTRFDVDNMSLDIGVPGTFGKYNRELGSPRIMQFGLRYEF